LLAVALSVFTFTGCAETNPPTSVLVSCHHFFGTHSYTSSTCASVLDSALIMPVPIIIRFILSGVRCISASRAWKRSLPSKQAGESSVNTNLPQLLLFPMAPTKVYFTFFPLPPPSSFPSCDPMY